MCGIVGIFGFNGKPINNLNSRIKKMTAMLRHRGPDQEGIFVSKDNLCAIGNTRLSITDPNCKLKLPLLSNNKNFILTFNGEIYNYNLLRKSLSYKGCKFKTKTDTEVLLEGLVLEDKKFLDKLDGMWAFGFYDISRKKLILSRDLLGERHLFYCVVNGQIIFASEPQPIIYYLKSENISMDIDDNSVICSMFFYACEPGKTLIKNIKRLFPGRNIICEINKEPREYLYKKLHPEKWFDFFLKSPSEKKIFETFNEILSETVNLRTPLDVPYISSLSGGIDSAIVALYNSNFGKKKIDTLFLDSFGNIYNSEDDHKKLTEKAAARITSSKLKTSHHEFQFDHKESPKILLDLSKNCFDCMFEAGFIMTRQLAMEMKKKNKKVIFMSDGLDELLGYADDYQSWEQNKYFNSNNLKLSASRLFSTSRFTRSILRKLGMNKFIIEHPKKNDFYFSPIHSLGNSDFVSMIIDQKNHKDLVFSYGTIDNIYDDIIKHLNFSQKMALSYCNKSLPDWFNLRSDKGFFGTSVECRLIFQDPKLVEFLISAPDKMRFSNKKAKIFARNIVKNFISEDVSLRKKYGQPMAQTKNLPEWEKELNIKDTIANSDIFNILPFKKGAKEKIINPKYGFNKYKWILYCITRTMNNLKLN